MSHSSGNSSKSAARAIGESDIGGVLTRPTARGRVLQELVPIVMSLPWLRSQHFWSQAGVEAFTSGEVPYIATNDGEQSRKALEVYLASLRTADRQGGREALSYVLEIGAGSGLFAKLFLDQLKERSIANSTNDYERTIYIVGDFSPGLLGDTRDSGVFAEHEARVVRVLLPTGGLGKAIGVSVPEALGKIRAIHANYVFDSLPFTILSVSSHGLFELRIRTRILEHLLPAGFVFPAVGDSRTLESSFESLIHGSSPALRDAITIEAEYVRVAPEEIECAELLPSPLAQEGETGQQWVHGYGAVQCLEDALRLVRADGHVIVSDYGYEGALTEPIEFQFFGASVAAGVNFAQLGAYARARPDCVFGVPDSDPTNLQSRLFARGGAAEDVVRVFRHEYGREVAERAAIPYQAAVELAGNGQYEAARWKFEEAYRIQPWNWSLLEGMVSFLTYTLEDHDAGLEIGKRALALNHLSPRLWNLLGDCYYGLGAFDSAEQAYRQAVRVNPSDVRGRTNLSYVFLKRGAFGDALRLIGEALALDRSGACRDELLAKQGEALAGLAGEHLRGIRGNLTRLSGHHALPCRRFT